MITTGRWMHCACIQVRGRLVIDRQYWTNVTDVVLEDESRRSTREEKRGELRYFGLTNENIRAETSDGVHQISSFTDDRVDLQGNEVER